MIPDFLKEQLTNQYGEDLTNQILEGYNKNYKRKHKKNIR